jgi:hypothetical protein
MFGCFGRVTYVVDKEGKIIMIFDSMLATKHIPKALEAVKKLTSSKADNSSYKLQNTESCLFKIDEYEYKSISITFDPIVGTNLGWRKIKASLINRLHQN